MSNPSRQSSTFPCPASKHQVNAKPQAEKASKRLSLHPIPPSPPARLAHLRKRRFLCMNGFSALSFCCPSACSIWLGFFPLPQFLSLSLPSQRWSGLLLLRPLPCPQRARFSGMRMSIAGWEWIDLPLVGVHWRVHSGLCVGPPPWNCAWGNFDKMENSWVQISFSVTW
jgi:hypothetical protein